MVVLIVRLQRFSDALTLWSIFLDKESPRIFHEKKKKWSSIKRGTPPQTKFFGRINFVPRCNCRTSQPGTASETWQANLTLSPRKVTCHTIVGRIRTNSTSQSPRKLFVRRCERRLRESFQGVFLNAFEKPLCGRTVDFLCLCLLKRYSLQKEVGMICPESVVHKLEHVFKHCKCEKGIFSMARHTSMLKPKWVDRKVKAWEEKLSRQWPFVCRYFC